MTKQAHVFIKGFVQGVGFRQFVKDTAKKQGITGWVRNMSDGRVEAVFQSSASSDQEVRQHIEQLIALCGKGPMLSSVEELDVVWEEQEQLLSTFDVKTF